jgi:hypothetical protein
MMFRLQLQHRTVDASMLPMSAPSELAPTSGASMSEQHQRHALSAIAVGLVMLLSGCANANAAAAQPASPTTVPAAATPTRTVPAQPSAKPNVGGDDQPGCAARAMERGNFDSACSEYQGYLDPGTAGGRAPTSGEIQQQTLCRRGEIPKNEC